MTNPAVLRQHLTSVEGGGKGGKGPAAREGGRGKVGGRRPDCPREFTTGMYMVKSTRTAQVCSVCLPRTDTAHRSPFLPHVLPVTSLSCAPEQDQFRPSYGLVVSTNGLTKWAT